MLPPFPRLRGWKAGGWHTFFLSLVHALALMRQNARFLATKPRSGTKPGFLRSERRSASSKIPGRKKRRETEGVRSSSTRARTRFRGQKRPVLLHDRERGAQMVERRASEARNDPNGRHGLQAMCQRMLHPKRLVAPKGPHQARHRPPPATAPALTKNGGRSQAALPCSQTVLPRSQAAQRPPRQAPHPPRQRSASTVPVAALPPCSRLTGCKAAFSRRRRGRGVSREAICTHSHTDATAS